MRVSEMEIVGVTAKGGGEERPRLSALKSPGGGKKARVDEGGGGKGC